MSSEAQRSEANDSENKAKRDDAIAELKILLENVGHALYRTSQDKTSISERRRNELIAVYERRIAALKLAIEALAYLKE